ncbi:Glycoprotein gp2 [Fusarium oxysporum f. sp. albedinis]|nr:Glycoprotein gp2 [Fusarium oxysporum f. sp. albedinis]
MEAILGELTFGLAGGKDVLYNLHVVPLGNSVKPEPMQRRVKSSDIWSSHSISLWLQSPSNNNSKQSNALLQKNNQALNNHASNGQATSTKRLSTKATDHRDEAPERPSADQPRTEQRPSTASDHRNQKHRVFGNRRISN